MVVARMPALLISDKAGTISKIPDVSNASVNIDRKKNKTRYQILGNYNNPNNYRSTVELIT